MAEKIVTVKNLETGIVTTVVASHFAVTSDEYEVVVPKKRAATKRTKATKAKAGD